VFLAWVLIYASYDKIWQPGLFAQDLARYELLPIWLVNSASVMMAWLEMVVGVLLAVGAAIRAAAMWASALFLLFIGVMVYAGVVGAGYDCGCFPGGEGHTAGFAAALRDLAFLLPALWLAVYPGRWLAIRPGMGAERRDYW